MERAPFLELWSKATLKSLFLPGGVLLLAVVVVLKSGWVLVSPSAVEFYYFGVMVAGVLLAWRFHSTRVFLVLLTIFLSHRALLLYSSGRMAHPGTGRMALEVVAILVPLNFVLYSIWSEKGWSASALFSRLAPVFFESIFVVLFCRPDDPVSPKIYRPAFLGGHWFHLVVPPLGLLVFFGALATLLGRFLYRRKPVDGGLLWSLVAFFFALEGRGTSTMASAYIATAGLVLVGSIVENSYLLAFHDELTTLPARRAFNDNLLRLERPYAIAIVDIDHFKKFNDSHGHEVGDQVLRMVASKLARVSGGGQAFRIGGEEFAILFPGKMLKETTEHLELLRQSIQDSVFRVRMPSPAASPVPDRRRPAPGRGPRMRRGPSYTTDKELSVTVSIGVAEPGASLQKMEQVLRAADKALYKAKEAGRNQVVVASPKRTRFAGRPAKSF